MMMMMIITATATATAAAAAAAAAAGLSSSEFHSDMPHEVQGFRLGGQFVRTTDMSADFPR